MAHIPKQLGGIVCHSRYDKFNRDIWEFYLHIVGKQRKQMGTKVLPRERCISNFEIILKVFMGLMAYINSR